MKKTLFYLVAIGVLLFSGCQKSEFAIYVSTSGDDANSGTKEQPFATLQKAYEAAIPHIGKEPVSIYLREGVHYISQPITLTSTNTGTEHCPVKFSSYPGEHAAISTAVSLNNLDWKEYKNGIMQAAIDRPLVFDQLFINGQKQSMARYPNYVDTIRHFNGYSSDAISPDRVKNWANPAGGFIHAMHSHEWGGYQYSIEGKDSANKLILEGGFQNNRQMGMHDKYRMVENIFEELDAEGEWYYNKDSKTLYFYPPKDIELKTALIEVPQCESIFVLNGTEEAPIRCVEISGLELKHTLRTFMKTHEPLLRSDWTIYRNGTVMIEGAENCIIRNCFINEIGGNAIFFSNYNRNNTVEGNHITNVGASGICFVGSPDAVRSPSFEYKESVAINKMDTIAGTANNNYPAFCIVDNNLIHNLGQVEKQVAGVHISMAKNITVSHNSIYNLPRAGINISEGTWGGHVIEWNDVFNTVLETGDHGSFNSWGRDRFWYPNRAQMDSINKVYPHLIHLDAIETTIIRNNRWRCDHGWDIDLDDGSSNYHIYNNLCLNGGLKLREGFNRTVENNIMVNNSFHPHVWFDGSGDVFKHNIVTRPYYPIQIGDWGNEVDYNLFPDAVSLGEAQKNGTDKHSLAGDPLFINPDIGDYRVKDNSPALEVGFKNFDMDKFGVQNENLKKLASQPELPIFNPSDAIAEAGQIYKWLDSGFKDLSTEGERSATGMDAIRGVLVVEVVSGSPLAKAGLKVNDVILMLNNTPTDKWSALEGKIIKLEKSAMVNLTVFRNQERKTIKFVY